MQIIIITIGYGCKPISLRRSSALKILIFQENLGKKWSEQPAEKIEFAATRTGSHSGKTGDLSGFVNIDLLG
jgi:hypothetical protein